MALTDNLLHYRKLDETTGATSILNSVTATGEGTLANLTWGAGKINNGASFNGTSSGVDLGTPTDLAGFQYNTAFTFSAWIKSSTLYFDVAISKDGGGASNVQYRLMLESVAGKLAWGVGNGTTITGMGPVLIDGNWHHIVGVCTGSGLLAYVDGAYVGTGDYGTGTSTTNTYLGRRAGGLYLNGSLDEFGVWNRVLTPSEIASLYNAGNGLAYPLTSGVVKALVVAGGGSGGCRLGGGGGAGGLVYDAAHTVTSQAYTVTVGNGGTAVQQVNSTGSAGNNGQNSVFDNITALGGGGGGAFSGFTVKDGGSGGGAGGNTMAKGNKTQGDSGGGIGYGFDGGATSSAGNSGAGGGGTSAVGGSVGNAILTGGTGGAGRINDIAGSTSGQNVAGTYYLAGGGGGCGTGTAGGGGNGGGGAGVVNADGSTATSGTTNTGGGGGGGSGLTDVGTETSGAGGSGVVVISYPTDGSAGIYPTSTGGTITTSGGNTIHTFTSTGTFTAVTSPSLNTGNFFLFFN